MKRHLISISCIALSLLALTACVREGQKEQPSSAGLRFTASVGGYATKATDTAFETGDMVGISAGWEVQWNGETPENVPATFNGETLVPDEGEFKWIDGLDADKPVKFVACYPYDPDQNPMHERYQFTVQADQSTHENYTASDLMFADVLACPMDDAVHFAFYHKLSQLMVKVDNSLDSAVEEVYITDVSGTIWTSCYASSISYVDDEHTGAIKACPVSLVGEDGVAEAAWVAIVPPQPVKSSIVVKTEDGKTYEYLMKTRIDFKTGRRHTASLVLDKDCTDTDCELELGDWADTVEP